jgi:ubiquitin carboxyl-terminal hydrolase 7
LSDLPAALDQYTAPELLQGDNRWRTEAHGLQEATKGVRFISFPPFLQVRKLILEYFKKIT